MPPMPAAACQVSEVEGRIDSMKKKMSIPSYDKTPDNVKADDADRCVPTRATLQHAWASGYRIGH